MNSKLTGPGDGESRRSVLAACAAGLALPISGCVDRVGSVVDQDANDRLSLSITTVPADGNREIVRIARHLEATLEAVGANVSIDMRSHSDFLESVLIEHDFDLYVGRHPADPDPDFLYETLHSTYANEAGWQNPFGFASIQFDKHLEEQRRVNGDDREDAVGTLLEAIADEKPFEPICVPEEHRIARTDRFTEWNDTLATRHDYLGLEPESDVERLHALVTDSRATQNLNPLSAALRERGTTIDLLYDSLATEHDGELVPWIAESWEWTDPADAETQDGVTATATVTLREDCRFHDGEPLTARDVAFTYEFLEDTALGRADYPSPAPRYRSQVSAIDQVTVEDDHRVRIDVTTNREVAERAFTVPILPRHRWYAQVESRTDDEGGLAAPQGRWGLVTMDNVPPIGSGPFLFANRDEREYLALERYDEHFTQDDDVDLPAAQVAELRFDVDPGSASSIERVMGGNADVTASMLEAHTLEGMSEPSEIERLTSPSQTFYHVGFNTRRRPFNDPHIRHLVARLLDKSWLVENVFSGYADPTATPLTGDWVPDSLAWDDEDPVAPFFGRDGELDVDAAMEAFEDAGFRYNDQGWILA